MYTRQSTFIWLVIFWFALLQAFSPLMHAHIESDSSQQSQGIHMHGFNTDVHQDIYHHQTIEHSEAHIITIDKGALKEDFQFVLPLLAILVVLGSLFGAIKTYQQAVAVRTALPLFHRYNTRPRAPPHC